HPAARARAEHSTHSALDGVHKRGRSASPRHIMLIEEYDPSLPPVPGDRDLLLQVLLNLVKNAAEAVSDSHGEIILTTAYRHGLRMTGPDGSRRHLPLMVSVADNGGGLPDELTPHP